MQSYGGSVLAKREVFQDDGCQLGCHRCISAHQHPGKDPAGNGSISYSGNPVLLRGTYHSRQRRGRHRRCGRIRIYSSIQEGGLPMPGSLLFLKERAGQRACCFCRYSFFASFFRKKRAGIHMPAIFLQKRYPQKR